MRHEVMFSALFFTTFAGSVPDEALPAPQDRFSQARCNSRARETPKLHVSHGVEALTKKEGRMITLIIACMAVAGVFMIAGYDYSSVKE